MEIKALLEKLRQKLRIEKTLLFMVKVHPKSRHSNLSGILADGTIKIQLKSPPEDGKANAELTALLSEIFQVSSGSIQIQKGQKSRLKKVRIDIM